MPTQLIPVIYVARGCKPFFRRYRHQTSQIKQKMAVALSREVANGMPEVKVATRQRLAGQVCYERRVNVGVTGSVRVAFTVATYQIKVFYISTQLQKAPFTHALEQVLGDAQ